MPDRASFRMVEVVGEAKALEQKAIRTGDERQFVGANGMEFSRHRARRIRRNVITIALVMSVVASIFVIGMPISSPAGFVIAIAMGLMAVVLPAIGYLYAARWYAMLDK